MRQRKSASPIRWHTQPFLSIPEIRRLAGAAAVFASAFCFYFSTVVIRWSQLGAVIDPSFFVFSRFLLGFVVIAVLMLIRRQPPRPRNHHLLIGRTICNGISVLCFYKAVETTTVAEANILNMTYPMFVAIFSWLTFRSQRNMASIAAVAAAMLGTWCILSPGAIGLRLENLWGLASGLSASGAILYLNFSRQVHDTETILLYVFGLGAVLILALFHGRFFIPDGNEIYYLFLCAAAGVVGQFLMTLGFRYVTAVEGSIVSTTRILLAALLGPVLMADPALSLTGWLGALLIFAANLILAVKRPTIG